MPSIEHDSDVLAKQYHNISGTQTYHGQILIDKLNISSVERVLDIGCGTGALAAYVAGLLDDPSQVTGVDPSAARIAVAKSNHPNLDFRIAGTDDLRLFEIGTFHVAYLTSVMHWIENKRAALTQIDRVLKKGGRLGFNCLAAGRERTVDKIRARAIERAGLTARLVNGLGSQFRLTLDDIAELLKAASFTPKVAIQRAFETQETLGEALRKLEGARASSSGNFLAEFADPERRRVLAFMRDEIRQLSRDGVVSFKSAVQFIVAVKN